MEKKLKVNRRKYPHRGIAAEIAKEQGVSQQAIWQAIELENPRIIEIYSQKLNVRLKSAKNYQRLVSETATQPAQ